MAFDLEEISRVIATAPTHRADVVRAGIAIGFELAAAAARARSLHDFALELEQSAAQLIAPLRSEDPIESLKAFNEAFQREVLDPGNRKKGQ